MNANTPLADLTIADLQRVIESSVFTAIAKAESQVTFRTKTELMEYLGVKDRRTIDRMVLAGKIQVLRNGHFQTDKITNA